LKNHGIRVGGPWVFGSCRSREGGYYIVPRGDKEILIRKNIIEERNGKNERKKEKKEEYE
jgi:hypothetical protein